jgi:hypothetical protein
MYASYSQLEINTDEARISREISVCFKLNDKKNFVFEIICIKLNLIYARQSFERAVQGKSLSLVDADSLHAGCNGNWGVHTGGEIVLTLATS